MEREIRNLISRAKEGKLKEFDIHFRRDGSISHYTLRLIYAELIDINNKLSYSKKGQ